MTVENGKRCENLVIIRLRWNQYKITKFNLYQYPFGGSILFIKHHFSIRNALKYVQFNWLIMRLRVVIVSLLRYDLIWGILSKFFRSYL